MIKLLMFVLHRHHGAGGKPPPSAGDAFQRMHKHGVVCLLWGHSEELAEGDEVEGPSGGVRVGCAGGDNDVFPAGERDEVRRIGDEALFPDGVCG